MTALPVSPIDAPGTGEAAWRSWAGLGRLPERDLAGCASLVVLAAHPDDEVLGAGGIIAMLAAAGARIRLVAVTDGEASHPGGADPGGLARRRAAERAAALETLGAASAEVIRLRLPDARLAGRDAELAAAAGELTAGFALCLAPWERDAHADHEAVGRAARQAHAAGQAPGVLAHFPVWAWHWARPADPRLPWDRAVRVRLPAAAAARKRAAIGCFASQLEPRPGGRGPVLAPAFVAHFTRRDEVLFPVHRS